MPIQFQILDWLFRVGWQSAVLVLLVLLVQRLFRRRLSAGWRHALWLVLVVRLLLPVTFTSAFSLLNFVSPALPPVNPVALVPVPLPPGTVVPLSPPPARVELEAQPALDPPGLGRPEAVSETPLPVAPAEPAASPEPPFDWLGFAFRLWLVGMVGFSVLAGWLVTRARRRLVGTKPIAAAEPLAILESCCRAMGLRTRPALAESPGLSTPALCGLWRPRILLPEGFADRFSPQELRFVFLHELAHLKRGDLFLNWLMTALQIVHWFNPLIWLAFARMRADRELACDELALAVTGEGQRHAYGETILHLLESVRRPVAIPGLVGILEDKHRLKERLERIAGFRKPSRWSTLAVVLLGSLAVVGLTDPQSTAPAETDAEVNTNRTGVDDAVGATASGRVLDADGNPVAGAEVLLAVTAASGPNRAKEARTDEAGHFVVPVSEEGVWQLLVQAPGWAPEWREFKVGAGNEPLAITLDRGRTIRGRVVDDRGDPVPDADVSLWSWRGIGRSTSGIRFRWSTRSRADGSFVWDGAPRDAVRLLVGKDGYRRSPSEYVAADPEGEVQLLLPRRVPSMTAEGGGRNEPEEDAPAAARILPSLVGTVTGRGGEGIADARLLLLHGTDLESRVIGRTKANGSFELPRRASGPGRLFVQATGWAPQVRSLQPGLGMEPVSIKLTDGRTLRGRVVDDGGQPVQDAEVRVAAWRGVDLLDWTAATDGDGRFVWERAPLDPVRLTASAPGFGAATEAVPLGDAAEVRIRLTRDFRFSAQVVDAGTGSVVTNAVLFRGWRDYWFRRGAISWDPRWRLFYGGGHFEISYPPNPTNEVCFAATAPGYLPEIGLVLTTEGAHEYTFKLRRGEGWSGMVVDPAGNPVAGAEVAECGADSVVMGKGFFHGLGGSEHLTRSKADGSFSLPARGPAPRFVAIHPTLGYGDVSQAALVRSGQIPLRPWGRIEGRLRWQDWIGSHEKVRVDAAAEAEPRLGYSWADFSTQTDAEGRFVLDLVPPGRNRLILEHSLPLNVEVNAGEPTIVSPPYGATGLPVTGRALLRPPKNRLGEDDGSGDWFLVEATLGERGKRVYVRGWTGEDGRFLFPYVEPGEYDLVVEVFAGIDGKDRFGSSGRVPFSVPTDLPHGGDPLNLGDIVVVADGAEREAAKPAVDKQVSLLRADPVSPPSALTRTVPAQGVSLSSSEDGRIWFTVTYEGRPVAGAEVQLAQKSRIGDGVKLSAMARTDAEGRMFVYPDANAESVVIRHGNRFAEVPLASLTNNCVIVLEAEARLSGTLRLGGSPWPNQHLRIAPRLEESVPLGVIRPRIQVTTDAEGGFEFPALASGPAMVLLTTPPFATRTPPPQFGGVLHGYGPVSQRLASINLVGGQPNRLDLWLQGRPVKARAVWEGASEPPDWMAMEVLLVDRSATPWVMARGLPAPDGSILVPYAEPRSYELILELYRDPSTHELIGGSGPIPVTITPNTADGATPLDLGIIRVKPRPPKAARNDAPGSQTADASEETVVKPLRGIHGMLTLGGQAWTNQSLGLCPAHETVNSSVHAPSFKWTAQTHTDEQGRYHFPEAGRGLWEIWLRTPRLPELPAAIPGRISSPPVEYPFGRRLARVEIFDQETVEANIHKTGRIITGRAVVANPIRPVDLRASFLTMRIRDSMALEGLTGAWVAKDGSFTIPCLDPGEYELHLGVEGYPAAGSTTSMHAIYIGAAEPRLVSVATNLTEGTAPIELGEIPATLRKPLFLGDRATDFKATTLEGNPLQLADWFGQPVLLIFSCPNQHNLTRGELRRLDEWYLDRAESERPAVILLGVGSPEDIDWLRAGGYPWPTIDSNTQRKFFETEYEATWTPDFILLDPEGRVTARHYRFDEIRPPIDRLMQDFNAASVGKEAAMVCRKSLDFDVFWPPHDPSLPDHRRRRPILKGVVETRVVQPADEPAFAAISITLTRPRDETSREFWNNRLAFPEHEWMSQVRVWDANQRWLWPNLPYLLRLPGKERVERYGGVDPGKDVDNDFAAVLVRSFDAAGNETTTSREQPLVTAEWQPADVRGAVNRRTVAHVARSEGLRVPLGNPRPGSTGKLAVWLIYADFMGFDPPSSWPKEPEYAGGALAWFEIDWQRDADGNWHTKIRNTAPPGNTGFDWARWVANRQRRTGSR